MPRERRILVGLVAGAISACGGAGPTNPGPSASPDMTTGCVPTLSSPSAGATLDNGCALTLDTVTWDFAWSACPGAESYHLYVTGAGAGLAFIDDATLTTTSYRAQTTGYIVDRYRLDWRWRVRSKQQGTWNPWSAERRFDVEPIDSDCPRAR